MTMIDTDKVIRHIAAEIAIAEVCRKGFASVDIDMLSDALTLLKERYAEVNDERKKVEFIESYIKIGNSDYQWNDNHGELIRCKDCKWYDERISLCDNCGLPREQTFFCADGRRNDKDE